MNDVLRNSWRTCRWLCSTVTTPVRKRQPSGFQPQPNWTINWLANRFTSSTRRRRFANLINNRKLYNVLDTSVRAKLLMLLKYANLITRTNRWWELHSQVASLCGRLISRDPLPPSSNCSGRHRRRIRSTTKSIRTKRYNLYAVRMWSYSFKYGALLTSTVFIWWNLLAINSLTHALTHYLYYITHHIALVDAEWQMRCSVLHQGVDGEQWPVDRAKGPRPRIVS